MNRRTLLVGASTFAVSHARAQPMPIIGPVGGPQQGGGPLWSFLNVPPGASLDLSFLAPGTMPPLITFTRASTATYFDATGTMQSAPTNTPRWDYDPVTLALKGLLLEDARTNILLNSATLSTQSVTVTAQLYTLSFYGTGTITLSGVSTAGPLVGTGAFPTRVSQSFTPTAGTLTLTVTGSVLNAQLEATQDFPTSYIPTTGAAASRAIDSCLIPPANMGFFTAPGGSWFIQFDYLDPTPINGARMITRADGTSGSATMQLLATRALNQFDSTASLNTSPTLTAVNTPTKGASTWTSGAAKICANGGPVATSAALTGGYAPFATTGVRFFPVGGGNSIEGHLARVRYWPRILADAELQAVTR